MNYYHIDIKLGTLTFKHIEAENEEKALENKKVSDVLVAVRNHFKLPDENIKVTEVSKPD